MPFFGASQLKLFERSCKISQKIWLFCAFPQALLYSWGSYTCAKKFYVHYLLNSISYFVNYVFEEDIRICRYVVACVGKYCVASGQIGKCINAIAVSAYRQRWTIRCSLTVVWLDTLNNMNIFYNEIMGKIVCFELFIFLWCYFAFTGLVKPPELNILKVWYSQIKCRSESTGQEIEGYGDLIFG